MYPDVTIKSLGRFILVRVIGHGEAVFSNHADAERYVRLTSFFARQRESARRWGQD